MLPGEGIAGVLEEPTAAKTQTVDPVFECKAVDAVQTPLAGPTHRGDPLKTVQPLVSHADEQCLATAHGDGKHPLQLFGISAGTFVFSKSLARLRAREPLSSPEQVLLCLLGTHRCAGQRKGGDERMRYPTASTAYAKDFNLVFEMIFAVYRVTSKPAALAAVGATLPCKQPPPFIFEGANAIVLCRTVEYYNC